MKRESKKKVRNFFKLTKWKIIILIFLFSIFPWKGEEYCFVNMAINSIPVCHSWIYFAGFKYGIFILLDLMKGLTTSSSDLLAPIIIMLAVSYFLSNIIMFSYKRVKKLYCRA